MPHPSASVLASLITSNVDSNMAAIHGFHPLLQHNPIYFNSICHAIGTGIINGGPTINFTTDDTGLAGSPPVTGTGVGLGIIVDSNFFKQHAYTLVRNAVISQFGHTNHDPYPPGPTNSGQYLKALCDGIADAVTTLYATNWDLNSTHPDIYQGTGLINNGQFSGLSSSTIASLIQSNVFITFNGIFWPNLCSAIAQAYVDTIQLHSTGSVTITGTCIPSISQICNITNSTGHGSGVAT